MSYLNFLLMIKKLALQLHYYYQLHGKQQKKEFTSKPLRLRATYKYQK